MSDDTSRVGSTCNLLMPAHTDSPDTSPGTPRADDPRVERTRAAVIDAAVELLTTDGPSSVTHANVAAAANMSRTTVYNHWPTQADLLRDTIESLGKVPVRTDQLAGDLRTDLDLLCAQLVADLVDDQRAPMIINMMARAMHDATVITVRDEFFSAFTETFRHVIETAIDNGQLRADLDADRSIATLLGSFLFQRFMSPAPFTADFAGAVLDDFVRINAPTRAT